VNGLNFGKLEQEGESVEMLEMFFSGFPKMVGLQYFPNLEKLILMGQQIDKLEGLSFCPKLKELWASECSIRVSQFILNSLGKIIRPSLKANNCSHSHSKE
jgi:Leucine-rich repeat (LRR) protein